MQGTILGTLQYMAPEQLEGLGADARSDIFAFGAVLWPRDTSLDGRFLLYMKVRDLWILPLDGDGKPYAYLAPPAAERDGRFSPDGRWVAYTSDESGRQEVFVQDLPATDGPKRAAL